LPRSPGRVARVSRVGWGGEDRVLTSPGFRVRLGLQLLIAASDGLQRGFGLHTIGGKTRNETKRLAHPYHTPMMLMDLLTTLRASSTLSAWTIALIEVRISGADCVASDTRRLASSRGHQEGCLVIASGYLLASCASMRVWIWASVNDMASRAYQAAHTVIPSALSISTRISSSR
jgi:hypothetical protein